MGKKSAASKGFRNYNQNLKKEKESKEMRNMLIGLVVFAAVVALVLIGVRVYDRIGLWRVRDGAVVGVEEGDVLLNTNNQSKPRIYRMARVTEPVPGYTAKEVPTAINTVWSNDYVADDENAPIGAYMFKVGKGEYTELVEKAFTSVSTLGTLVEQSGIKSGKFGGKDCRYFHEVIGLDKSEAQDGSDMEYDQWMYAYFDSEFKGYSIMVTLNTVLEDENPSATEEEMTDLLEQIAQRFVTLDKFGK